MKKKLLIITLFIITLLSLVCFTACKENEVLLTGVKLDESNKSEIIVGGFNYDDYKLVLSYSDGSTEKISINESMLNSKELINLYKAGDYTLNISYGGFSVKQDISVKINTFSDEIKLVNKVVTYDGNKYGLEIAGPLPEGTSITYPRGNSFINANTYTITAVLASDLYVSKTIEGELTIEQADYDMSGISFNDSGLLVYDGKPKSISVTGTIPTGLTLSYYIGDEATNERTNAGTYEVEARFNAGPNYKKIPSKKATLTIEKGNYDMSNYKLTNKIVTYNGKEHSIILTNGDNLPNGVTVDYENNNKIKAGQYTVIAHFVGDSQNYNEIADKEATLTIAKANISLKGVSLDSNKFTYDGQPHALIYDGKLPDGVSFVGYENNNQVNAGEYEVKANFIYCDTVNFNPIEPVKGKLVIEKTDLTGLVFNSSTFEYDGLGHSIFIDSLPSGLDVTYTNNGQTQPGEYKVVAKFISEGLIAQNYNLPSDMEATLTISKKIVGSNFKDVTVEYDGTPHTINALSDSELKNWINVKYYTIENNNKINFTGAVEPGEYLIFAEYTCKDAYLETYSKYYEELDRESAILKITKMHYTPFLNERTFIYDGTEKKVTVNTIDLNSYYHLDFNIIYENNAQTEIGIYNGKASFELTGDASKYYYPIDPIEFNYCIRGNEKEVYTPIINGTSVVYDGKGHSITAVNLLDGISVSYQGNNAIEPGNHVVTAIFSITDPILDFYYQLPSSYNTFIDGNKYTQVSLLITKKTYALSYNIGPFVYDGENREINAIGLPNWIKVDYEYNDDERIVPGEYSVTCKPTIIDSAQAKYYQVKDSEVVFTIVKAVPKYTFSNLVQKYDGELKRVEVLGLPEGIEAVVSGDLVSEVGSYKVEIAFVNNNPCYTNIITQQITLTIENNVVDIGDFVAYSKAEGIKSIAQFSRVVEIFSSRFNLKGLDINWSLTYYNAENQPYPKTDVYRNATGYFQVLEKSNQICDFEFSEYTDDNEYCFFMYSIKTTKGYILSDSSLNNQYTGSMLLRIGKTIPIDITSLHNAEKNIIEVNQYDTFKNTLSKYLDISNIVLYYDLRYYKSNSINYPNYICNDCGYESEDNEVPEICPICSASKDKFKNLGIVSSYENNADYVFSRNTWNKLFDYSGYHDYTGSYILANYTIVAKDGYCLQLDDYSCPSYKSILQINVNATDSVDLFLLEEINNKQISHDKYLYISDLFNNYVDIDNVEINYSLYNKGDKNPINIGVIKTNEYQFVDTGVYTIEYNVIPKEGLSFYGLNTMNYSGSFDVNINDLQLLDDIDNFTLAIKNTIDETTIYQYTNLNDDILGNLTLPDHTNFYVYLYQDNNLINQYYDLNIDFNYVSDNTSLRIVIFANDGYVIKNIDNNSYSKFVVLLLDFKVEQRKLIDISDFIEYTSSLEGHIVLQYSKLSDEFALIPSLRNQEFIDNVDIIITVGINDNNGVVEEGSIVSDYIFNNSLQINQYYSITYTLQIKQSSSYLFDRLFSSGITLNARYIVQKRTAFSYQDFEGLENKEKEVNQYSSFISSLDDYNIPTQLKVSIFGIEYRKKVGDSINPSVDEILYVDDNEYNYIGTINNDFIFMNHTESDTYYYIELCYVADDNSCILNADGVGEITLDLHFVYYVNSIEFVDLQNIDDTIATTQTVRQFTKLSDYINSLFVSYDKDQVTLEWTLTTKNRLNYQSIYSSEDVSNVYFDSNTLSDEYFELYLVIKAKEGYIILDEASNSYNTFYYNCNLEVSAIYEIDLTEFKLLWNNNNNQIAGTNNAARANLKDLIYLGGISNYVELLNLTIYKDGVLDITYDNEKSFLENYDIYYLYNYGNTTYTFTFTLKAKDYCCFGIENNYPITTYTVSNVSKTVENTFNTGVVGLYEKSKQDKITVKPNELVFTANVPEGFDVFVYVYDDTQGTNSNEYINSISFSNDKVGHLFIITLKFDKLDSYISYDNQSFIAFKYLTAQVKVLVTE